MNRTAPLAGRSLVVIVVLGSVLCFCLALAVLGLAVGTRSFLLAEPTSLAVEGLAVTSVPSATSNVTRTQSLTPESRTPFPVTAVPTSSVSPSDLSTTEARLRAAEPAQRDIRLLAERLTKTGPIPIVVHHEPPTYGLGDEDEFWVGNMDTLEQAQVTAVLRHITPHLYVWVERGLSFDQAALVRSAEAFETRIYPTTRAFFGSEWSPGIDGDLRLHILNVSSDYVGQTAVGYYSSTDEYSRLANPYSNEREMFTVVLGGSMAPGGDWYEGVLAHELQHMIHWASDRNEETWVNEGCSELAAYLNGYDLGGFEELFLTGPDVQLTTWPELHDAASHYGSSYLFMLYFLGRFGQQATVQVVAHPANGTAGFDAVLSERGLTFDQVFADWLIANYADSVLEEHQEARYAYPDHTIGPVALDVVHDDYPVQRAGTVHQYAADYVELRLDGDVAIEFSGQTQVRLTPVDAHSGRYAWWSNRGDDSDATLTRAFDLRGLDRATLDVWMWYDIETDWDYGYVQVSTDNGQTWDVLAGPSSTTHDPNGNSFGAAYTGMSEGWIEEVFDLSAYAGSQALVRFEYVTDDAVNHAGWLIDDICVPELGECEDLESGAGDWVSSGFVYSDNRIAQRYLVQLVVFERRDGSDGSRTPGGASGAMRVLRMPLDEAQRGRLHVRGLGQELERAVLVISALAPVTTEVATYKYVVKPFP
jgi:immune inhibitor A